MADEEFFDAKSHFDTPREAVLSRAASREQATRSNSAAAANTTISARSSSQSKRNKKKTAKQREQETKTQEAVDEYADFVEASPVTSPTAPQYERKISEFIEAKDISALSDHLLSQCNIETLPSYTPVKPLTGAEVAAIRSKALKQPVQKPSGINWLARLRNKVYS